MVNENKEIKGQDMEANLEEELVETIGEQRNLLSSVQRTLRNFKKDAAARKTESYHQSRLENLSSYRVEFRGNHRGLIRQANCPKVKEMYMDTQLEDKFEDSYLEAVDCLRESLSKIQGAASKVDSANNSMAAASIASSVGIPLPVVALPTFSGNFVEWPSFKEIFCDRVHNNESLNNLQRFHYLKSSLAGDAAKDIQHISVVAQNYMQAWKMLCDQFDNNRILFSHYMDVLYQQSDVPKHDAAALKHFTQTCRSCVSSIEKLGVKMDEQNQILVYFLVKKLPDNVRMEWERSLRKQTAIPKFSELCCLLDEQYAMMLSSLKTSLRQNTSQIRPQENLNRGRRDFQAMYTSRNPALCQCCSQSDHPVRECPKFLDMTLDERREEIGKLKLCYNCLGYNHISSNCSSQRRCTKCNRKHHTLIHSDGNNGTNVSTNITTAEVITMHTTSQASTTNNCDVLLPTAVVAVKALSGQIFHFRALLDQCSQVTVISEKAAQSLGLPREKTSSVHISGLAEGGTTCGRFRVKMIVGSRYDHDVELEVMAYILPKICGVVPARKINPAPHKHLLGLPLADSKYYEPQVIDILLGNDIYDDCIMDDICRAENGPIAQKTKFGYIVSGKTCTETQGINRVSYFTVTDDFEIDNFVKRFWEMETIAEPLALSEEDRWCEEFYTKTHKRLDHGKYMVRLPLKSEIQSNVFLSKSKSTALKRFFNLENRLQRDTNLKKIYSDTINEYLRLGQMHPVKTSEEQHCLDSENGCRVTCCYLPHHPVVKEAAISTKVRIVFDASAKSSNGKSLNDILAVGPALQRDLSSVLTNWRRYKYVFMTDIEKMFRCIDVHEDDAQYQRILWREESGQPIQELYCSTVMFGTASAPYTAIRTIHQVARDDGHLYPHAAKILREQMYVDDILSGADTVEEALTIQQELINILKGASFELRKWASNQIALLQNILPEHRYDKDVLQLKSSNAVKALGMYWDPNTDDFTFAINFEITLLGATKRTILSTIARLFDPLGWVNPVIVSAKIFLQKLWALKRGWDMELPMNLQKEWEAYARELKNISLIRVGRYLNINFNSNCELHIFCDASKDAHAAVAYIRGLNDQKQYIVKLLQAKSKVNPIKPSLTIPRAELCGAVLATKLFRFISLNFSIRFNGVYMWTDSTIVLHWIRGDPSRWKPFVYNRINKILSSSDISQWHHTVSGNNPADLPSRGVTASRLADCNIWWEGPAFLKLPCDKWPKSYLNPCMDTSIDIEKCKVKMLVNATTISKDHYVHRFSSFSKLTRVTAYCIRFYNNCKGKIRISGGLTSKEIDWSQICLVRLAQQEIFGAEWHAFSRGKDVAADSNLRALNPFFDRTTRTIRLGGRLKNALLSETRKHPHILPTKHHITELIINSSHLDTLHGGVSLTLNYIRRQYWILNGRKIVRTILHRCLPCFKNKPKQCVQQMGNLPLERVRPARAFTSTGIDYAGPFNILPSRGRGRTSVKGYIALFICLVTKAIHLEVVGDLTADTFLGALNRFIARRGLCSEIYSDCGTNFIGANGKLRACRDVYQKFINENIFPSLAQRGIKWHFNPPSSPHFGGLWEAGVKSVKYHLKRTIGEQKLTFEEFTTVLAQIESCLNSRPLCPLNTDQDDLMILTPGHFLIGDALFALPERDSPNMNLVDRWHHGQKLVQQFWKQWQNEYLSRLQRRPKWLAKEPNLQTNDLVLIKDERYPSNRWPLGRIIELHPGDDGIVRVVTLRTTNGLVKRPIVKICPLPIQDNFQ